MAMMYGCPKAWSNANSRQRSGLTQFTPLISGTDSSSQFSPKICISAKSLMNFLVQREAVRIMGTLELSHKCDERQGLDFLRIKDGALDGESGWKETVK